MTPSVSRFEIIAYIVTVVTAVALLFIGYFVAGYRGMDEGGGSPVFRARVTALVSEVVHETHTAYIFEAEISRGERRGEVARFSQNTHATFLERHVRPAQVGDRIMLRETAAGGWGFTDYVRIHQIVILGGVFVVMLLAFGRSKGFNALLALGLTAGAIFLVFIPSIMAGRNIYFWAVLVCVYTIFVTLFIINGISRKSAAAIAGCIGGVVAAGLLTVFMNASMMLSGITQSESNLLLQVFDTPVDLNAIIFAGILIGAVGAIMDMAVSISSALWEIKEQQEDIFIYDLYLSGVKIGKDIIGSNINTLILAYIGSSLTIILIWLGFDASLFHTLNRELIIVELLKAIVGSFGIFLTMPLTALVCAFLYTQVSTPKPPKEKKEQKTEASDTPMFYDIQ